MSQSTFEILAAAYALKHVETNELREKIVTLEEENTRLRELLKLQQTGLFGAKSESSALQREPHSTDTTAAQQPPNQILPPIVQHIAAHTRLKKCGRQLNTAELPRYQIIYDLPDDQKTCSCCRWALHFINKESSEKLEIIPVRYCIVEYIRMKYGCRTCQTIVMSPVTALAPIIKGMAGASVIADVILNKYHYHLPLYRQSKIMKSHGIDIPDNTLGNWIMKSGDGLLPLYDAFWVILKSRYLQVDETPVKLLKPDKKGYLWSYYAPHIQQEKDQTRCGQRGGLVVFEMSESRRGTVATERLENFSGLLQTDGYAGYNTLREREGIVGLGCLTHARRKFNDVIKITNDKNGIAAEMIERIKPLYALEARMKEAKLLFHTRKRLRQKIAWPLLKNIHQWLRSVKSDVPPKSKLADAIHYTLSQWRFITAYVRHGMAEIDTNGVENKIRDIALGKKNWLFIGHKESGKIHALFYSLIISAVLNEINPRVYIHYLLTKIHDLRKKTIDPITLLPDRIDQAQLEQFAKDQIAFGKKILDSS